METVLERSNGHFLRTRWLTAKYNYVYDTKYR